MFYLSIGFVYYWYLTPTLYVEKWYFVSWYLSFQLISYAPNEKYFQLVYISFSILVSRILNWYYSLFGIFIAKWFGCLTKKIGLCFSFCIKSVKYFQLVFIIGIKISNIFISFYWYQNFCDIFKIFCLFSIGIMMFRCIPSY